MKTYFSLSSHINRTVSEKELERNALLSENLLYQQAIREIRQSFSWKVTAPLRRILSIIHRRR